MGLSLPQPGPGYSQNTAQRTNQALQVADGQNLKQGQNINMGSAKLILKAPNGSLWALTVSNSGVVSAVAA